MAATEQNPIAGMITIASVHSVDETLARLQKMLEAKSVHIFAIIDHSGEAQKAGLQMPNTKLIIFGSPKAGTPLMLAAPTIAIDLPLKILVWEDAEAKVWVGYNSPEFLCARHNLSPSLLPTLAVAGVLAAQAAA